MQQQMLDRILRSQWHGKGQFHSGDILNRLEIDVRTVVSFLTETLPSTVSFLANVYRSVPLFDDDGRHTCPTYCGNDTCFHCFK